MHDSGPSVDHSPVEWPKNVLASIGKFMYSIILQKVMLWNPLHAQKYAMFECLCMNTLTVHFNVLKW